MTASDNTNGQRGVWKALAMLVLGFAIAAGMVHLLIRDPLHLHADWRSEKLWMLEHWQGTVSSAVFGSSHVHNGFDPRVFDRAAAGTPLATRTANLAIAGGSQSEQRVTALEYLKRLKAPAPGSRACLVMLELNAGANFTNDHLVHPRAINSYDWPTTRLILHMTTPGMGLTRKAGRMGYALAAFGLHEANVGMLSNLIFAPPLDQALIESQTADDRRGLKIEPALDPATQGREIEVIRSKIAAAPARPSVEPGDLSSGSTELIEQLQAASRVRGISWVYLVMPKIDDLEQRPEYPEALNVGGQIVPIVNLANPERFPQLYRAELWHDPAHVDEQGAAYVTELIEKEIARIYAAHGGPAPCGGKIALR